MSGRNEPDPLDHLIGPKWFSDALAASKQREWVERKIEQARLAIETQNLLSKQAYELDKQLPKDAAALEQMVRGWGAYTDLPMEARAKVLEVIILRGANNELSYGEMGAHDWHTDFSQERQYQALALSAVLYGKPELFSELSKSRDLLPDGASGRYPATEWMNTMLRTHGLMGNHEARQKHFEPWLLNLPPEQRGQAMFHLRDAVGAQEVGKVREFTGFELSAASLGFGLQWQNPQDSHWKVVRDDVMKPVTEHLKENPGQARAFYDGYRLADRELPDPPPRK